MTRRSVYIGVAAAIVVAVGAWTVGTAGASPAEILVGSPVDPGRTRALAESVPVYPGSREVGYRDLGRSTSSSQCHGRSAQVTYRGRIGVVWDVTRWYDRTLTARGWQIFGGADMRSHGAASPGPDSFVEHGYITKRQSVGVWLPADEAAHAQRDPDGLTTWHIDYGVMDGDGQTVSWCALSQVGPLGT